MVETHAIGRGTTQPIIILYISGAVMVAGSTKVMLPPGAEILSPAFQFGFGVVIRLAL